MRLFYLSVLCAILSLSAREVPVRYLLVGDSLERESMFIKMATDTVYLLPLNAKQQEYVLSLYAKMAPPEVTDSEDDGGFIEEDKTQYIPPAATSEALPESSLVAEVPVEGAPAGPIDDFAAALAEQDKKSLADSLAKEKAIRDSIRTKFVADSMAREAAIPMESKYIKIFKLDFKRLWNIEDSVMIDLMLKDYVVPDSIEEEEPIYPEGKANLFVSSVPDSCRLFINGEDLELVTPDTIRNIKPGKYTISIVKHLKDVDWWGAKTVKINGDSLNRVSIPLDRPQTRLTIATIPEAVEVYFDKQPTESIMPEYMTDVVIDDVEPSLKAVIYLRKMGYLDTAIVTEIKAFMPNPINVEMQTVDNLSVVEMQREYNEERTKRWWGRGILWSSIVPFVAGGVLWYFAEQDWSDAADKKDSYDLSAFESEDTRQLVKDNKELNDNGDKKAGVAIGLGALGLGLLAVGFVFAF